MQIHRIWGMETLNIQDTKAEQQVWISATGSKYHSRPDCGNMNPSKAVEMPVDQAVAQGYEACKKCW